MFSFIFHSLLIHNLFLVKHNDISISAALFARLLCMSRNFLFQSFLFHVLVNAVALFISPHDLIISMDHLHLCFRVTFVVIKLFCLYNLNIGLQFPIYSTVHLLNQRMVDLCAHCLSSKKIQLPYFIYNTNIIHMKKFEVCHSSFPLAVTQNSSPVQVKHKMFVSIFNCLILSFQYYPT